MTKNYVADLLKDHAILCGYLTSLYWNPADNVWEVTDREWSGVAIKIIHSGKSFENACEAFKHNEAIRMMEYRQQFARKTYAATTNA